MNNKSRAISRLQSVLQSVLQRGCRRLRESGVDEAGGLVEEGEGKVVFMGRGVAEESETKQPCRLREPAE